MAVCRCHWVKAERVASLLHFVKWDNGKGREVRGAAWKLPGKVGQPLWVIGDQAWCEATLNATDVVCLAGNLVSFQNSLPDNLLSDRIKFGCVSGCQDKILRRASNTPAAIQQADHHHGKISGLVDRCVVATESILEMPLLALTTLELSPKMRHCQHLPCHDQ